jgi:hypothetical protein
LKYQASDSIISGKIGSKRPAKHSGLSFALLLPHSVIPVLQNASFVHPVARERENTLRLKRQNPVYRSVRAGKRASMLGLNRIFASFSLGKTASDMV